MPTAGGMNQRLLTVGGQETLRAREGRTRDKILPVAPVTQ